MSDRFYFALKLIAAVVSAVYGFYATVTDFRVEKNGQKVLSRKGYLGLTLLVIATAVSLSTDLSKEHRDNQAATKTEYELNKLIHDGKILGNELGDESATLQEQIMESRDISTKLQQTGKKLDKTQDAIQQNAVTTDSVLLQTRRMLNPITHEGFHLGVSIVVPPQPLIRPYMNRIDKDDRLNDKIYFPDRDFPDERRPEERELALLADSDIQINFVAHDDIGSFSLFYLAGRCNQTELPQWPADGAHDVARTEGGFLKSIITYPKQDISLDQPIAIHIECSTSDINWYFWRNIISWADLDRKRVTLEVRLPKTEVQYDLMDLTATQNGQDIFFLNYPPKAPCSDHDNFATCFSDKAGFGNER